MTDGGIAISVPVVGDGRGLPAALTAVMSGDDAQINLTVAVLRSASFAISKALAADTPHDLESRRL